ncbi:hypothetical protein LTR86_011082 [Recurvomyces mirabilis]|nr:hypothetical protein LTR86_011082 [Recurvomyces mirabilis]
MRLRTLAVTATATDTHIRPSKQQNTDPRGDLPHRPRQKHPLAVSDAHSSDIQAWRPADEQTARSSTPPEQYATMSALEPAYTVGLMDQFILFGDSMIQQSFNQNVSFSFAGALADVYQRKLDIVNRGLSSYNTSQAIRALSLCIPEPEAVAVRFLLIFFGANDARIRGSPGGPDQNIPLEEFMLNLQRLIRNPCVTAHPGIRIILVTTPPIDERKTLQADREKYPGLMGLGRRVGSLRRTAVNTAAYAQAVRDVGVEVGVPVLDIHRAMLARAGQSTTSTAAPSTTAIPNHVSQSSSTSSSSTQTTALPGSLTHPPSPSLQQYLHDGLHFSGEGYRLLHGELMTLIERTWPEQMPDRLPLRLPAWDHEPAWRGIGRGGG